MDQPANPPTPSEEKAPVRLFLLDRETASIIEIPLESLSLRAPAVSWTRIVANRAKWEDLPGEVASVLANATKLLLDLGVGDRELRRLAQARIVEVCIRYTRESEGWEYRILPWEFILIRALRPYTSGAPSPVIVRCLDRTGPNVTLPDLKPVKRALAIVSCPAKSHLQKSYEKEMEMVRGYLEGRSGVVFESQPRATYESIGKLLQPPPKGAVDAIHFLGVEAEGPERKRSYLWLNREGKEPSTGEGKEPSTGEGKEPSTGEGKEPSTGEGKEPSAGEGKEPSTGEGKEPSTGEGKEPSAGEGKEPSTVCNYEDAANLLTAKGTLHPRLVAFSFCHSGPRLAAHTVAGGAHASIGFQDIVLDDQCQNFFGCFYRIWSETETGWEVLAAFERALREISFTLEGTGIILWLDRSRLEDLKPLTAPELRAATSALPSVPAAKATAKKTSPPKVPAKESAALPKLSDLLVVSITPRKSINYALLHNQQVNGPIPARRSLFEKFSIERPGTTSAFDVDVVVRLYAGDHVGRWRERVSLKLPNTDLAAHIHVPLTSILARSLRESLRTSIETTVSVDGKLVDHHCHPVSLLAIEEWLDDGICHIWLPSFVLPRDPAVGNIIQRARRCLCALLDDYTAGFDGYQWGLPERVDTQVQAIWATLSLEWQFAYINPPPSFTSQSQRLRRPSAILEGAAGTCLDLALLFAACLEYVDIDPILILANGHAYVGWWRQEFDRLSYTQDVAAADVQNAVDDPGRQPETPGQSPQRGTNSWVFGKDEHPAILKAVDDGKLTVIETTGLTRHLAFSEAIREGAKRLRSRLDFEWLIDVKRSRSAGITPLPMCL